MPQINCRPDGNIPAAPHQIRYYSPIVEGDFEFVSYIVNIIQIETISFQFPSYLFKMKKY